MTSVPVRVWWQSPIECLTCGRTYWRPPLSTRPCNWCEKDKA